MNLFEISFLEVEPTTGNEELLDWWELFPVASVSPLVFDPAPLATAGPFNHRPSKHSLSPTNYKPPRITSMADSREMREKAPGLACVNLSQFNMLSPGPVTQPRRRAISGQYGFGGGKEPVHACRR